MCPHNTEQHNTTHQACKHKDRLKDLIWGWDDLPECPVVYFWICVFVWARIVTDGAVLSLVSFNAQSRLQIFGVISSVSKIFYTSLFFRHPSLQESQGSSTSLSSTKVSSSVDEGDGPVNEGEETFMWPACLIRSSVGKGGEFAKITLLNHVHDLSCMSLSLSDLYIMLSSPLFLTLFPSSHVLHLT